MRDIEEGEELLTSYFPINWPRPLRQQRLREEYGFECACDRCELEKAWCEEGEDEGDSGSSEPDSSEGDGDDSAAEDLDSGELATGVLAVGSNENAANDIPDAKDTVTDAELSHGIFFVKHLCSREDCGGTLVACPGRWADEEGDDGCISSLYIPSKTLQCNVCDNRVEKALIEARIRG